MRVAGIPVRAATVAERCVLGFGAGKATVQCGIIRLPASVLALHPPSTRLFIRLASATLIYNSNHLTASAYH